MTDLPDSGLKQIGKIGTFYSYKGGTGRSLALANVAWLLAANGYRVLAIDWDLEAPGLHRYFLPFLRDPELTETRGLMDFLWDYANLVLTPRDAWPSSVKDANDLADVRPYVASLENPFVDADGCLHFFCAGQQVTAYAARFRDFDWRAFYERQGGGAFIDALATRVREQYDFVLIDSRTGVADTSGICTVQLPDEVVLCFTYNRQSVKGVAAVARSIRDQRDPPLPIWPVPMRVETGVEGLNEARDFARDELDRFLPVDWQADERAAYWNSCEIAYYPDYAFGETLAVFRDRPQTRSSLVADMKWLAERLLPPDRKLKIPSLDPEKRETIVLRYRLRDPRKAELAELLAQTPTTTTTASRLLDLAGEATRRSERDPDYLAALSDALTTVAARLSGLGRREEALRALEEAVAIRRRLAAEARPDAFLPDLATSLNNLSIRLSDLGRREEALKASEEAVAIRRRLAEARPDAFLPDLATSLNNLGVDLSNLGRREEALQRAEEAVGLYRELARARPEAFTPDLAMSLNNLATTISELGRREEALQRTEEAVGLYRELARARPEAFTPNLAGSLNNLATRLSELGRREEALQRTEEAVGLYRELARARPEAFTPDLAMSLNNLATKLSELGRREEALQRTEEAVGLYHELARARPEAFTPNLAGSLNNLATRLSELGRREEALQRTEEAVGLYRELARARPEAFTPDLAMSLNNLATRLSELGRREEALALQRTEEAVAMSGQYFISYSRADGERIAVELADQLAAGPPTIDVWLDRRRLQPGVDWDEQLVEALRSCEGVLFVMTSDSVSPKSQCKSEWTRALKYKKPVIPLLFDADAELPYRLEPREYIDFVLDYKAGLARVREHIRWRATPEGVLHTLEESLEDAQRDLTRADAAEAARIEDDIAQLGQQIAEQRRIIADPRAAEHRTDRNIRTELERVREEEEAGPIPQVRFVNPPPMVAPTWFQDRHVETKMIGDFLADDAIRMITVVGRGGVGKTAMVCRLLKSLERGRLPDDLGPLDVDGIVYLSGTSLAAHGLSFPSLFLGLCKLLPEDTARRLEQLYKEPEETLESQMRALLEALPGGPTIVLLDNFDSVIDFETLTITNGELDEALRTILRAPQHGVKIIITTRVAPKSLLLTEPGRQQRLDFDQGLEQSYAENILRELDRDGRLGLKTAPDALLAKACERTRGYPRALEALAGILSADRDTSLTEILADTASVLPENVVEVLVGEAFTRLDLAAQHVMQALAVYGAPVPAVAVDYLLRPYTIGIDSGPVLGRLVNMHFARRDASRYYLHQIDREYALRCIPEGQTSDRAPKDEPAFTRYALLHRAAEYFRETRKPRESWKSLDDLAPCLAEFELRCAAKDFDAAARVLLATKDCLETWGHYRLLVDLHQRVHGRLIDAGVQVATGVALAWSHYRMGPDELAFPLFEEALALARSTGNRAAEASVELGLGHCARRDGDCAKAIDHYETVRALARDGEDRANAAAAVGSLATIMHDLGKMTKAIQYGREALRITREIGDRQSACLHLVNVGCAFHRYGDVEKARRHYQEASEIADEIGYGLIRAASRIGLGELLNSERRWSEAIPFFQEVIRLADEMNFAQAQIEGRLCLAQALLGIDDLCGAEAAIDEARRYSFRLNSPNVFALTGVIALRKSDFHSARNAFKAAVAQADDLLDRSCSMWNALYAKALALAGLALCDDAGLIVEAAETYRRAYAINSSPGTVQDVLHELDSLRKADRAGLLKAVFAIFDERTTSARWPPDEPHQPPDSDTDGVGKLGDVTPRAAASGREKIAASSPPNRPRPTQVLILDSSS